MLPSLPSPENVLNLVADSREGEPLSGDEQVIDTVAEELSPLPSGSTSLSKYLTSAGYTGDNKDSDSVKQFLFSSLQAKRILAHRKQSTAPNSTNSSPDYRLSSNISRLFFALDIAPKTPHDTPLSALIDEVTKQLSRSMLDCESSSSPLQNRILSTSDLAHIDQPSRLEMLSRILVQLQKEQLTRIGLLLTRLQVTTESFSHAQRSKDNQEAFLTLARRSHVVQKKWAIPYPLSLFQSLTARNYLLIDGQLRTLLPDGSSSAAIKDFVMGSVPDRGGRISVGSQMPEFKSRVESSASEHSGKQKQYQRRKGASGKGRRRR